MASLSRCFYYCRILETLKYWTPTVRLKSDAHIVMTDDSSTIVCWHPEPSFPYEKSLPIIEKEAIKSDSVLKVQSHKQFLSLLKPKREQEVVTELASMTYTTKHIWFPKKKQFRRKPSIGSDRPYL